MLWITRVILLFLALIILFLVVLFFIKAVGSIYGAPWVPTSKTIVHKMLAMAEVKPGDVLYDLGSGDGRIITMAAQEFDATSVGIDINPFWVVWTRAKVALFHLSGKVEVVQGNFFNQDLSKANIVTLYLLQDTNDKLKPKLENECKAGMRVVSHVFTLNGWNPQKVDEESKIYLYRVVDKNEHSKLAR